MLCELSITDKIPEKDQVKGGKDYFGLQPQGFQAMFA
jgi:hypothetical protein